MSVPLCLYGMPLWLFVVVIHIYLWERDILYEYYTPTHTTLRKNTFQNSLLGSCFISITMFEFIQQGAYVRLAGPRRQTHKYTLYHMDMNRVCSVAHSHVIRKEKKNMVIVYAMHSSTVSYLHACIITDRHQLYPVFSLGEQPRSLECPSTSSRPWGTLILAPFFSLLPLPFSPLFFKLTHTYLKTHTRTPHLLIHRPHPLGI